MQTLDAVVEATRTAPPNPDRDAKSHIQRHWARRAVAWLPRIALVVAMSWVGILLWHVGVWHVVSALARVGWGVVAILVLPAGGLALHTVGWAILLPADQRPRPVKAFSVYVASQAGNELGGGVLGESVKLLIAPPGGRTDAVAALIVDNVSAFVSTLGFGALALAVVGVPSVDLSWGVWAVAAAIGLVAMVAMTARNTTTRIVATIQGHATRLRTALATLLRRSPMNVVASLAAHSLGKAWIIVEFAVVLTWVGDVPVEHAFALGPAAVLATIVGAPVPGKAGVLEASALWTAQGHPSWFPALLAVVLLRRVYTTAWTVLGVCLMSRLVRSVSQGFAAVAAHESCSIPLRGWWCRKRAYIGMLIRSAGWVRR